MGRTGDRNITNLALQYMAIETERRSTEAFDDSWRTRMERHRSDYVLDIVNRRADAARFKLKRQGHYSAQDQWNRGMWGTLLLASLTVTSEEQEEYARTSPNAKHGARLVAIIAPERLVVQRTIDAPAPARTKPSISKAKAETSRHRIRMVNHTPRMTQRKNNQGKGKTQSQVVYVVPDPAVRENLGPPAPRLFIPRFHWPTITCVNPCPSSLPFRCVGGVHP